MAPLGSRPLGESGKLSVELASKGYGETWTLCPSQLPEGMFQASPPPSGSAVDRPAGKAKPGALTLIKSMACTQSLPLLASQRPGILVPKKAGSHPRRAGAPGATQTLLILPLRHQGGRL